MRRIRLSEKSESQKLTYSKAYLLHLYNTPVMIKL